MTTARSPGRLALALLATTMLTGPGPVRAAPGDAVGPELPVNSFTNDNQSRPDVAMEAGGNFVVAWRSNGQDGSGFGVFAQRFDAAGVAQGDELWVNSFTTDTQGPPAVASDSDGDFVVVWQGFGNQDGDDSGIFAQRYDGTGEAQGAEFPVNAFTTGAQGAPDVAMDADGDFVVAWADFDGRDGSAAGVFARRHDAQGLGLGSEFRVNTFTAGSQFYPSVGMDADGDFVVVWTNATAQDGSDNGVFAQRYDAAGTAQDIEFQVNSYTTGDQRDPAVAMDADGDFVVAWTDYGGQDGDSWGIFAQRFDAAGAPQGDEFQVNTFTTGAQRYPAVAMDADGDFVVAWTDQSGRDGSYYGVFAQRYDAAGLAQGPEFQVNSFTTDSQSFSALAMDADGDLVVTWTGSGNQDGSGGGIFAQRYDGATRVAGDFDGDGNADLLWRHTGNGKTTIWLMEGTEKRASKSIGKVSLVWEVAGTGDFNGDGRADILWRNTKSGATRVWQMNGFRKEQVVDIGKVKPAWVVEKVEDTNGDGNADIFWRNENTDESIVWQMLGTGKAVTGKPGKVKQVWQVQ